LLDPSNMDPTQPPRPQSSHRHTLSDSHASGLNGFNHGHPPMPLPGGPQTLRGANGINSMGRANRRSMINDDGGLSRSPPLPPQTKSMRASKHLSRKNHNTKYWLQTQPMYPASSSRSATVKPGLLVLSAICRPTPTSSSPASSS